MIPVNKYQCMLNVEWKWFIYVIEFKCIERRSISSNSWKLACIFISGYYGTLYLQICTKGCAHGKMPSNNSTTNWKHEYSIRTYNCEFMMSLCLVNLRKRWSRGWGRPAVWFVAVSMFTVCRCKCNKCTKHNVCLNNGVCLNIMFA